MPIVSTGQITITDVNDSPSAVLSNESAVVPANPDGSSPVLTGCITTLSVNLGGVDDSLNWTVTATPSSGVTGTLATRTYTVTGFTVDAGWVDLTATRVGWPSLTKRFNLSKTKQGVTGATGAPGLNGLNFSEAKLMFTDPTFQVGTNSLSVYNNASNGTVTHTRVAKQTDSPFTDSGFNIEIANTGAATPGIGGFFQSFNARASAVFVQRIVAKVPVGYYLEQATNALGDGATNTWITSKAGTGKFEEYILIRRCGATGSFSSSGHIYAIGAAGTPSVPVKWWLAYAAVYDFTALGFSSVVGLLSNDSHTVPTDSAGNNGNFTGAATTLTIYNGTTDDSANWSVTAAPTNITGTLSGKTYTVTALSADTGYVDLTATRGGFSNVVKRFTLSKSKGGVTGATGATGAQGPQGVQGPAVVVTPDRATTFTATDGTLDGSQADIVFTAAVSGVTSPTYAWAFSGLQTNPTASTTATQTVTAAQFGTSKAAIVTCTVSGAYTDKVTIVRLERSTAEAGANQTFIDANGAVQGVSSGAGTTVDNNKVIVGGRNTFVSSARSIASSGGVSYNASHVDCPYGFAATGDNDANNLLRVSNVILENGPWTVSWEMKGSQSTPVRVSVDICDVGATQFFTTNDNTWKRFSLTVNVTNYSAATFNFVDFYDFAWAYFFIRNLKVERGNKATDWSPSPEDVQAEINKALNQLSDIASDAVLAPAEKREVRKHWDIAINEKAGLNTEAGRYTNAAAANTAYNTAIQTLGTYLNGGTAYTLSTSVPPVWINDASLGTSTAIVGATFRTNWQAHFVARQALVNKITEEAGKVASWAGVSGTGKPLDNAGQVLDTRNDNTPPNGYTRGNHREFKLCTAVGITTSATYCVVETIKGWGDSSGGEAVQWAYVTSGEVWKRSAPTGATTWNAWVRDLDLGLYTGDLNATNGAPAGTMVNGVLAQTLTAQADSATALLADISSDNRLTPSEKLQAQGELAILTAERQGLLERAAVLGVATAEYTVAHDQLVAYTTPLFASMLSTDTIIGTEFRAKFQAVYTARSALLNLLIAEAGVSIAISASAAGFQFLDGVATPPEQHIAFTAERHGTEAPITFVASDEVPLLSDSGMLLGIGAAVGLPTTGDGSVAYLSLSDFAGRERLVVTALCAGRAASTVVSRLDRSTAEAGATVGAPAGTTVGGTPAETVAANANAAYAAVNDPATGLNSKLKANADNVLGGVLVADVTTAPVGMRVGSVTWDAAGTVTGGSGVAITPKGVYARNPSKTTFVLDATTGDATFSGNLTGANITGATGTFSGSLTAETLGSLAQPPVTITTTGNVTVPAGMNSVRYELVGGGGGGGGGATAFVAGYGGGGGSGAYMSGTLAVTAGATLAITIGTGGVGGANTLAGGNGTASSIGALVTAAGGTGGGGSAAGAGFGVGGATPTSVPTAASKAGATAARVYDGLNTTHDGYGSFNGEAKYDGAGFPKFGVTGAGGANPLGTGGASVNTGVGSAGTGYGSGGAGGGGSLSTNVTATGGAGRPGMCRLTFLNSNGVVLQSQFENLKQVLAAQGIAVA